MPAVGEGEGFEAGEALGTGLGEGVVLFITGLSLLNINLGVLNVARVKKRPFQPPSGRCSRFDVVGVPRRTGKDRGFDRGQLRREHQGPSFKTDQTRP